AGTVATHAPCLRGEAIKVRLLLGRGILIAADLLVLGGIVTTAPVDCGKLGFRPRADPVYGPCPRRALRNPPRGQGRIHLRRRRHAQHGDADERRADQEPSDKRGEEIRHNRPSEGVRSLEAAGGASHSRFFRRRHVVSAAPVWRLRYELSWLSARR